jgi:hypothetical protein
MYENIFKIGLLANNLILLDYIDYNIEKEIKKRKLWTS